MQLADELTGSVNTGSREYLRKLGYGKLDKMIEKRAIDE